VIRANLLGGQIKNQLKAMKKKADAFQQKA
jgi:hypothetical protein